MAASPPNILPNEVANAGREYTVTTADTGNVLFLGNASDGRVGTFVVQFDPGASWSGSFTVKGRAYGKPASDNGLGFVPIPYRRINLGGTVSDRTLVSAALTGSFLIEVPANGIVVVLAATVTTAGGTLYSWSLNGPAT